MNVPEFVVHSRGAVTTGDTIEWREGDVSLDLSKCRVLGIERVMKFGEIPVVRVEFFARLVETGGDFPR